jgi:hypothetical protein
MDSEIIIHFTHNSEKKFENTFILNFLQQFKEKHVKYKVFQLIFTYF